MHPEQKRIYKAMTPEQKLRVSLRLYYSALALKESGLRIGYQMATAEAFSVNHANTFDMVTCLELLEHVPEPGAVVSACHRLVKPDGDVFFATLLTKCFGFANHQRMSGRLLEAFGENFCVFQVHGRPGFENPFFKTGDSIHIGRFC